MTASGVEPPHRSTRAVQIAAGLWQAGEAVRMLVEQAEGLGLPAPTVVNERLTWTVMKGFAAYTQRYAEHLAEQEQPKGSGLVIASPDDVRRLLASMRQPTQGSPRDR